MVCTSVLLNADPRLLVLLSLRVRWYGLGKLCVSVFDGKALMFVDLLCLPFVLPLNGFALCDTCLPRY